MTKEIAVKLRTIQLLSSIVSVFLVSITLHAADYHVWQAGPDASDDGPGTLDKPWKTITKAAATVQAGDTVFIHAGIYAEAVAVKNAGSEPRPIVFKAFGDDEVILEGADAVAGGKWQPVLDRRSIHGGQHQDEFGQRHDLRAQRGARSGQPQHRLWA
jgi:hypothetical protein